MFEIEGFGKRVQGLRKQKNMTQEDLAVRLNVTPQAVSKWENDQSYPDIVFITTLATVLGTDINFLFGKKEEAIAVLDFVDMYEGLPLVHKMATVACYSDKTVASTDETSVKFTDGSVAELSTRLVTNNGTGEIRMLGADESNHALLSKENGITTQEYDFGYVENVEIDMLCNECHIVRSPDDKTHVHATGEEYMMSRLKVDVTSDTLYIRFTNLTNQPNNNTDDMLARNKITVALPCEIGTHAHFNINGMGKLKSEDMRFKNGNLNVNGSGDARVSGFENNGNVNINGSGALTIQKVGNLNVNINGSGAVDAVHTEHLELLINGSGAITVKETADVEMKINGSGAVDINKINGGNFNAAIQGSGSVSVGGGTCEAFKVEIHQSGNIDAQALTARTAQIILHQDGDVTLGRVLASSTEQIKKKGKIRILNRGA